MSAKGNKQKITGRVIWAALTDLQEPSSAFTVATYIGALLGLNAYDIRQNVLRVLDGGVRFGFIQKHKNMFFIPDADEEIEKSRRESSPSNPFTPVHPKFK